MIPFNSPFLTGKESQYLNEVLESLKLCGDGKKTAACHSWLEKITGAKKALFVHSGTAALEMAALLADIKPGDEIIMPSFTFVSTANAFVLRGGVPVFVDIREDTLNLDEKLVEKAITAKTKAIVPVHYAGVMCEMDAINELAKTHKLLVIEDAAQALDSRYRGRRCGELSDLACLSFHETKNVIAGEGGAVLTSNDDLAMRAEIIREKGTNRKQFLRGQVDKYSWVDIGSSYLPSELNAAILLAQLESHEKILGERIKIWNFYHQALADAEKKELLRRPVIPAHCEHNGHMYYVLLPTEEKRNQMLKQMNARGVQATFHYVPLHPTAPGKRYGRAFGDLKHTTELSGRILRLPLWIGVDTKKVIDALIS